MIQSNQDREADLQSQMASIRQDIDQDVEGLVENARRMTDWTHYVRTAPWVSLAAAAAVGYLAVPEKLFVESPDAKTMAKLARDNRVVVESKPKSAAKSGVAATAFTFLAHSLMRAGVSYVGRRFGDLVNDAAPQGAGHSNGNPTRSARSQ